MEFTIGATVFLSSMLLLAVLARTSAANPDALILRGDIVPSLLAVLVSGGLSIGPVMMVLGGEQYFPSRIVEFAVIAAFAAASVWIILRVVARARQARPGGADWSGSVRH